MNDGWESLTLFFLHLHSRILCNSLKNGHTQRSEFHLFYFFVEKYFEAGKPGRNITLKMDRSEHHTLVPALNTISKKRCFFFPKVTHLAHIPESD